MNFTINLVHRLAESLANKLQGFTLTEVFSSGREELFLNFHKGDQQFGMKMTWAARGCFLFFQDAAYPKPVPHLPQFPEIRNREIQSIQPHANNRSFQFTFADGYILAFKLYNGLSNVIVFHQGKLISHFRTSIESDLQLTLSDFTKEDSFISKTNKNELEDATDLFEACNAYSKNVLSQHAFDVLKQKLQQQMQAELHRLEKLVHKSEQALELFKTRITNEEIGHILMANLHAMQPKQTDVELLDFYRNQPVQIKLKKELSAQQNAEYYYRKAKNQKKEEEQLQQTIQTAQLKTAQLQHRLQQVEQAISLKELRALVPTAKQEKEKVELFRRFEHEGFVILVGKNAANNDLLTMKHAHKNDLWLHAKDVAGSHVVIKHQAGKPFTKKVIEYAASLAAHYSKLKGSGLVPVAYIERKFVRKPKGSEPGEVVLDKENVILAEPRIN